MNANDKCYCNKIVKDMIKIFRKDGYITEVKELRDYVYETLKSEKRTKYRLTDDVVSMILNTEQYIQIRNNQIKMCSQCKDIKPDMDFFNKSSNKNGKRNICKDCSVLNNYEYRKENKHIRKRINDNYLKKIKTDEKRYEKFLDCKKKYYQNNRESIKRNNRKYCMKKAIEKRLGRTITRDEVNKAFEYKELYKVSSNDLIYRKFYLGEDV